MSDLQFMVTAKSSFQRACRQILQNKRVVGKLLILKTIAQPFWFQPCVKYSWLAITDAPCGYLFVSMSYVAPGLDSFLEDLEFPPVYEFVKQPIKMLREC
jgi:hypothetical protein